MSRLLRYRAIILGFTLSLATGIKAQTSSEGAWSKNKHVFTFQWKDASEPWLTYVHRPVPPSPELPERFHHEAYFHPILTPQGLTVTEDYPIDHLWQRGLWMAYTRVRYEGKMYDFWNQGAQTPVTAKIFSHQVRWQLPHHQFEAEHRWKIFDSSASEAPDKTLIAERWKAQPLRTPHGNLLLLEITQTNITQSPIFFPSYHYGGLGLRTQLTDTAESPLQVITSERLDRNRGNSQPARWIWMQTQASGAGVLLLQHSANFRYPTPVRLNPKHAQWSVAPSIAGDWSIEPGERVIQRFALYFADHPIEPHTAEALHQEMQHSHFFRAEMPIKIPQIEVKS